MRVYIMLFVMFVMVFIIAEGVFAELDGPDYYGTAFSRALLNNIEFKDIKGHWANISILKMAAQNIVKGYSPDSFRPDNFVTKEEAIAMIVRIIGKEDEAQKIALADQTQSPSLPYSPWAKGYLYQAVLENIITQNEMDTISWKDTAQRQEVGYWVIRALKLPPVYGKQIQKIYGLKDWKEFNPAYIPYLENAIQQKIMVGTAPDTFSPNRPITRAEYTAVLYRINHRFFNNRGLKEAIGEITSIESEAGATPENYRVIYKVRGLTGELFDIITGSWESSHKGLVVYKDNRLGDESLLAPGDEINFLIDKDNQVIYLEVSPYEEKSGWGIIKELDLNRNQLVIEDHEGKLIRYDVMLQAEVSIDGMSACLEDFQAGQEIDFETTNGIISKLTGYSNAEPGYIPPEGRLKRGKIQSIDTEERTITLEDTAGEVFVFSYGYFTEITKNGSSADLNELTPGSLVSLYFDSPSTDEITRILIEGTGEKIKSLYKGRIDRVALASDLIVLGDIQSYFYGSWIDEGYQKDIKMFPNSKIYYKGRIIGLTELARNHKNDYLYIAVSEGYGVERGIKAVVKTGNEMADNGEIEDAEWFKGELKVGSQKVNINESSIVIRNGSLVDYTDLAEDEHMFYITNDIEGNYVTTAAIVDDIFPTGYEVYKGSLDEVKRDGFVINRYSFLSRNTWPEREGSDDYKSFGFSENMRVLDTAKLNEKYISKKEFAEDRFYHEYYDDELYIIAKNGGAVGLSIWPDSIDDEVISIGKVETSDKPNKKLTLVNMNDWNEFKQKWNPSLSTLEVLMENALVLKDDMIIDFDEIKAGDVLYLVRDNNIGLVAYVKE